MSEEHSTMLCAVVNLDSTNMPLVELMRMVAGRTLKLQVPNQLLYSLYSFMCYPFLFSAFFCAVIFFFSNALGVYLLVYYFWEDINITTSLTIQLYWTSRLFVLY